MTNFHKEKYIINNHKHCAYKYGFFKNMIRLLPEIELKSYCLCIVKINLKYSFERNKYSQNDDIMKTFSSSIQKWYRKLAILKGLLREESTTIATTISIETKLLTIPPKTLQFWTWLAKVRLGHTQIVKDQWSALDGFILLFRTLYSIDTV